MSTRFSDLQQEGRQQGRAGKKLALEAIVADYNARYGSSHHLSEFDLYYQDVQKRIKDQQWPEADLKKAFPNARTTRSTSPSWWTCCSPVLTPST